MSIEEEIFKILMEVEYPELRLEEKECCYRVLGLYPHAMYCLTYFPYVAFSKNFLESLSVDNLHKWQYYYSLYGLILYHLSENRAEMRFCDGYLDEVTRLTLISTSAGDLNINLGRLAGRILKNLKKAEFINDYGIDDPNRGIYKVTLPQQSRQDATDKIRSIVSILRDYNKFNNLKFAIESLEEIIQILPLSNQSVAIINSVKDFLEKSQFFREMLDKCYKSESRIALSKTLYLRKGDYGEYGGPVSVGLALDCISDVADLESIKERLLDQNSGILGRLLSKYGEKHRRYALVIGLKRIPVGTGAFLLTTLFIYYYGLIGSEMRWIHNRCKRNTEIVKEILKKRNFEITMSSHHEK